MSSDRRIQPCEEFESQIIQAAFSELLREDYEDLQSQPLTEAERALTALEQSHRTDHLRHIERCIKRRVIGKNMHSAFNHVLRSAAMLVVVALLGVGTAFAFREDFRMRICDLLALVRPEYSRFSVKNGYEPATVPKGWVAGYYPLFLPEGYKLTTSTSNRRHSLAIFTNEENTNIVFQISNQDLATQIDTENATCSTIQINNEHAYLFETGDASIIIWAADSQYFSVGSPSIDLSLEFIDMIHPTRED